MKSGEVKDMNIDTKGEMKKHPWAKLQMRDLNIDTKGELHGKDQNIVTCHTHKTCQRVSVIEPLKQISVDQPCKFNTDLWLGHVGKHDTLDKGGDSDEMEMYMRGVII